MIEDEVNWKEAGQKFGGGFKKCFRQRIFCMRFYFLAPIALFCFSATTCLSVYRQEIKLNTCDSLKESKFDKFKHGNLILSESNSAMCSSLRHIKVYDDKKDGCNEGLNNCKLVNEFEFGFKKENASCSLVIFKFAGKDATTFQNSFYQLPSELFFKKYPDILPKETTDFKRIEEGNGECAKLM